jgi:hypothetical protein
VTAILAENVNYFGYNFFRLQLSCCHLIEVEAVNLEKNNKVRLF